MGKLVRFPIEKTQAEKTRMELLHRLTSAALEISELDISTLRNFVERIEDQAATARRCRFNAERSKVSTP